MAKRSIKRRTSEADKITRTIKRKPKPKPVVPLPDKVISTGSTLLDLAIYGTRKRGGGVPGGIVMEIFGPSSAGKTAILVELGASAQHKGGDVRFDDPEARLDREYAHLYGLTLPREKYTRSDTVNEMFSKIWEWQPSPRKENAICVSCEDSLAALSTEMEMESEDKMGMKRAKEFSTWLRKSARIITKNNWLVACTNQEREGTGGGIVTPGGRAIAYYSSLRIRITLALRNWRLMKKVKVGRKEIENQIGIHSMCEIRKSSIDNPFRKAPIYIVFGHGLDDIRANLQWYKDMTGDTKYNCIDHKWQSMEKSIKYIEEQNFEKQLRNNVIDLWEEIQQNFKVERKKKKRF
ncbi:MAG: hypothetical protein DRJ03_01015 [Chloroflexi bacterium]|nr:MAG: hypothetical protein DRJ03_01015 [Chloroflexota bacterium]